MSFATRRGVVHTSTHLTAFAYFPVWRIGSPDSLGEGRMKVVMDRSYCDASLSFCSRCSAAFFRKPMGTDRPCIVQIVDDGNDDKLHVVLLTDNRTLEFDLSELSADQQEELATEGWEALADFDPGLFRHGAADRWRQLAKLPAHHEESAAK